MSQGDEVLNHYTAVRLRVNGSGNLKLTLNSLDETESSSLAPLVMQPSTNREPTVLASFVQQRTSVEIRTVLIDEVFKISKLILFATPVATSYPQ